MEQWFKSCLNHFRSRLISNYPSCHPSLVALPCISDAETLLLEQGSEQADLWGINLYLKKSHDEWIEYDSMINLRPWQDNESQGVDNPTIRKKTQDIVNQLVKES